MLGKQFHSLLCVLSIMGRNNKLKDFIIIICNGTIAWKPSKYISLLNKRVS